VAVLLQNTDGETERMEWKDMASRENPSSRKKKVKVKQKGKKTATKLEKERCGLRRPYDYNHEGSSSS
jgi:hypothetical protein